MRKIRHYLCFYIRYTFFKVVFIKYEKIFTYVILGQNFEIYIDKFFFKEFHNMYLPRISIF